MPGIIEFIQAHYGDSCRLRSPLTKAQYEKARRKIPNELLEILQVSNGIYDVMPHPKTGKTIITGWVVYPLSDMLAQTKAYLDEYDGEGTVFAENGAGGFFVLKPDGKVHIYEYFDLGEEPYAENLQAFFQKWYPVK